MANKSNRGGFVKKIFSVAAMLGMMANPQASAKIGNGSSNIRTVNKDAIKEDYKQVRPESRRNRHGGFSGEGINAANRFLNQRQYRKKCRSNPHLYSSYKHRSKN